MVDCLLRTPLVTSETHFASVLPYWFVFDFEDVVDWTDFRAGTASSAILIQGDASIGKRDQFLEAHLAVSGLFSHLPKGFERRFG